MCKAFQLIRSQAYQDLVDVGQGMQKEIYIVILTGATA